MPRSHNQVVHRTINWVNLENRRAQAHLGSNPSLGVIITSLLSKKICVAAFWDNISSSRNSLS